jgi:hypothetical protein
VASRVSPAQGTGFLVTGSTSRSGAGGRDLLGLRLAADGSVAVGCREADALDFTPTALGVVVRPAGAALVDGADTPVATVAVPVATAATGGLLGDAYEPDDDCNAGQRLHDGETAVHDFADDPTGYFELVACEGATYTIETERLGPLADTIVELLSPDCAGVLAADDGGGGRASRLAWTAPADGT